MNSRRKHLSQQSRKAWLVEGVRRDGNHGVIKRDLVCCGRIVFLAIQMEKHDGGSDARPFVPVEPCLRLGEMERVSCGHLEHVAISIVKGVLRRTEGGLN